jgi:hypothetical protein
MGWYNADGLYVKFGTEEGAAGEVGNYKNPADGSQMVAELFIADMRVPGTATVGPGVPSSGGTVISYNCVIPKNARIEKVELITQTAVTSGGSATLDLGLKKTDNSTELDYNGLLAALPIASFNAAGETYTAIIGATYVGALIGTTLSENGYLTINYGTAAFTAGAIRIRIFYVRDLTS